jgi:transcription elongation factor GreA-like protein
LHYEKQKADSGVDYFFNVGERVFHEKLGVGHIQEVAQVGQSTMYTIDFGKLGKRPWMRLMRN